jgi:signal transduction histidine kinase
VDGVVAVGAAAMQVADALTPAHPGLEAGQVVVACAVSAPLLLARSCPRGCWWGVLAGVQVAIAASFAGVATSAWTLVPPLVALYHLAAAGMTRRLGAAVVWCSAAAVAEVAVINVVTGVRAGAPVGVLCASAAEDVLLLPVLLAGAWAAGDRLRSARVARAAQARRAVLEERSRLAADLHDVAAHHLSSLVLQAEALRVGAGADDAALTALAETGRRAMEDMRDLLTVLRGEGAAAGLAPVATLRELPQLLAVAARGGQVVTCEVTAEVGELPTAVSATAYRVLQEALSNTRRHAPGAPVRLRLARAGQELRVEVGNSQAKGPVGRAGREGGHGLAGMRERVGLLGGSLSAGPTAQGGWSVRAVLPIREVPVHADRA